MNKIYNKWMEAVENYCYECLNNDEYYVWYYLGRVHALAEIMEFSKTRFCFWTDLFYNIDRRK